MPDGSSRAFETGEPDTPPAAVCVPVRDEIDHLRRLIRAFSNQRGAGRYCLCLVFDGPQDIALRRARREAAQAGLDLRCGVIARRRRANAGRARRAALALGLDTLAGPQRAVLLTTDADSTPAPDWIAANRAALAKVDVVAGRIHRRTRPAMPHRDRLERYLERLYRLERTLDPIAYEPFPAHPCLGGASLGFRAEVYEAVGGFQCQATHEDRLIAEAARRAGYWFCRDNRIRVTTSSRVFGRAPGGLAAELRCQPRAPRAIRVDHPRDAAARYRLSAAARAVYLGRGSEPELAALAAGARWPLRRLRRALDEAPSADAFALSVIARVDNPRQIDLPSAERELARLTPGHGLDANDARC